MSLTTLKEELGIKKPLSKTVRESNIFKSKVTELLKEKELELKVLLSNIASQGHKIGKKRLIHQTIDNYEKDWDNKKDFNSPYQVSFREWSIARSDYRRLMKEKKSLKKDIEILNSFIEEVKPEQLSDGTTDVK